MKWLTHAATAAQRVAADEGWMLAESASRIVSPLSGWPTDWTCRAPTTPLGVRSIDFCANLLLSSQGLCSDRRARGGVDDFA